MLCKKCGNEIKEEESFCSKCGKRIKPKGDKKSKKLLYIILGIIILVIVGAVGIVLVTDRNTDTTDNTITNTDISHDTNNNSSNTEQTTTIEKLNLKDVQIGKEFKSINEMNEVSQKIVSCAWQRIKREHPNANWNYIEITKEDGCGRFVVFFDYVESSISESATMDNIIVWVKDIENNNMGYYTSEDHMYVLLKQWGTPLEGSNNTVDYTETSNNTSQTNGIRQNVKYKVKGSEELLQGQDTSANIYIEFTNNRFELAYLLSADSYYYMGTYVENGDNLTLNIDSINLGGEEMNLSKDEIGGEIQFKGKITNSGETIVITIENEELKFEL